MTHLAINGGIKHIRDEFVRWPVVDDSDISAVSDVLRSGRWFRYDGHHVSDFEKRFADYCGTRKALAVSTGTAALEIPMAVLGIGPGDEVIVPSYTFYSTASAVLACGASPVFCDIDPDSYNIDLAKLKTHITKQTKAVIPVHFAGLPADMDRLNQIADKHGIFVIEDCAHAHGARYKDKMAGNLSKAAAFSFQASKNLTSGEGGIVLTNDDGLYEAMYARHTCGRRLGEAWYKHFDAASNNRMTEMQAALLQNQFQRLEQQTEERLVNAGVIESTFAGSCILKTTQRREDWCTRRSCHLFILQYDPGLEDVPRELFIKALNEEGLPASCGYPMPLYRQPVFSGMRETPGQKARYDELNQPGTEYCCEKSIWIPQNCLLGSRKYSQLIVDTIDKIIRHADELRKILC